MEAPMESAVQEQRRGAAGIRPGVGELGGQESLGAAGEKGTLECSARSSQGPKRVRRGPRVPAVSAWPKPPAPPRG